jgi:hypothetical protein
LEEWTTPNFRNTPSTTNPEEEEIVDAPENDGNASMPEQVKRPNPWRKMMMMMMMMMKVRDVTLCTKFSDTRLASIFRVTSTLQLG